MTHKRNQYYLVEVPVSHAAPTRIYGMQNKNARYAHYYRFGGFAKVVRVSPDEGREMVRKLLGKGE